MAKFKVLRENGRMTLTADHGRVEVDFPERHIARIRYVGVGHESFVEPIIAEIEAHGRFPIVLAVDAAALSSYESGFRKRWTVWMDVNKPRAVLILSNSRLVAMGITLSNAVLGGVIQAFASEAAFEATIDSLRAFEPLSVAS